MTPEDAIEAGREILDPVMTPAGFEFVLQATGRGSGGYAAQASYRRSERELQLHYRYALGMVAYRIGEHMLAHDDYMRSLGVYRQSEYARFSRDEPLAGFHALRHDLEMYCSDFLEGSGDQFCEFAELLKAEPELFRGFKAIGS